MNFFKDFFSDYGKKIGSSFIGGFLGFGEKPDYDKGLSGPDYPKSKGKNMDTEYYGSYQQYAQNKMPYTPKDNTTLLERLGIAPYVDKAKQYYGVAEKYALKPIKAVYDFLPEQIQEDLKAQLTGSRRLDDDYYESLKKISNKYRGARVDLSGSGGSRAFTAGRAGGGGPVNRAQQAYGQNSLAFRLMEKAAGNGRINTQIAKNYKISGGRQTIALGNVGNIRPFRGKTKLT